MMARFRYRLASNQVVGGQVVTPPKWLKEQGDHPTTWVTTWGDHQEHLSTEVVGLGNEVVTRMALRIKPWPVTRLVTFLTERCRILTLRQFPRTQFWPTIRWAKPAGIRSPLANHPSQPEILF